MSPAGGGRGRELSRIFISVMEVEEEFVERKTVESVICPWCGTEFDTRPGTNCSNCGGPLPAAPQDGGLPDMPAPAPREMPKGFKTRMLVKNNAFFFGGIVLIVMNVFAFRDTHGFSAFNISLLFGLISIRQGLLVTFRRFDVLQHGEVAKGEVIAAGENTGEEVNGKHPYYIKYRFTVNGKLHSGAMNCWDESSTVYRTGDQVWVVYLPKGDEYRSSLWPPVA